MEYTDSLGRITGNLHRKRSRSDSGISAPFVVPAYRNWYRDLLIHNSEGAICIFHFAIFNLQYVTIRGTPAVTTYPVASPPSCTVLSSGAGRAAYISHER